MVCVSQNINSENKYSELLENLSIELSELMKVLFYKEMCVGVSFIVLYHIMVKQTSACGRLRVNVVLQQTDAQTHTRVKGEKHNK